MTKTILAVFSETRCSQWRYVSGYSVYALS